MPDTNTPILDSIRTIAGEEIDKEQPDLSAEEREQIIERVVERIAKGDV